MDTPTVTLKVNPGEYADIVRAIQFAHSNAVHFGNDSDADIKVRREYKDEAVRLQAILTKLT